MILNRRLKQAAFLFTFTPMIKEKNFKAKLMKWKSSWAYAKNLFKKNFSIVKKINP